MILAAIDIGTNSTRFLLADYDGERLKELKKITEITRLGEGVDETRILKVSAMERTAEAVQVFAAWAKESGAERIEAIATSAVRDAKNSSSFIKLIEEAAGIKLKVLSGKEEALMAFKGATFNLNHDGPVLVIDIGGGSTELILGQRGRVESAVSLDIGSVRLTEMFLRSDPPGSFELEAINAHIHLVLGPALKTAARRPKLKAIGVAGTVTTIASISLKMDEYKPDLINGHKLTIEEVGRIKDLLAKMSLSERKGLTGLEPKRADIIVSGAAILHELMLGLGLSELIVSEEDILDGAIISMNSPGDDHPFTKPID